MLNNKSQWNSKIFSDEWKQKHNVSKLMGEVKAIPREKFIAINSYTDSYIKPLY